MIGHETRCPACNPIHGGQYRKFKSRGAKLTDCAICKNTRRVSVEVATRYMNALNGMTISRTTGLPPESAQPEVERAPRYGTDDGDPQR